MCLFQHHLKMMPKNIYSHSAVLKVQIHTECGVNISEAETPGPDVSDQRVAHAFSLVPHLAAGIPKINQDHDCRVEQPSDLRSHVDRQLGTQTTRGNIGDDGSLVSERNLGIAVERNLKRSGWCQALNDLIQVTNSMVSMRQKHSAGVSCGLAVESRRQNCDLPCTPAQPDDRESPSEEVPGWTASGKSQDVFKNNDTEQYGSPKRTSKHGSPTALLPFRACCKRSRSFREEAHVETPEPDTYDNVLRNPKDGLRNPKDGHKSKPCAAEFPMGACARRFLSLRGRSHTKTGRARLLFGRLEGRGRTRCASRRTNPARCLGQRRRHGLRKNSTGGRGSRRNSGRRRHTLWAITRTSLRKSF